MKSTNYTTLIAPRGWGYQQGERVVREIHIPTIEVNNVIMVADEDARREISTFSERPSEPKSRELCYLEADEGKMLTDGRLTSKSVWCLPRAVNKWHEIDDVVNAGDGVE